jgi:uncharacterized protein (DUF1697 family)
VAETPFTRGMKVGALLRMPVALPKATFKAMVDGRPKGFGEEPGKYHSDAIFLLRDLKLTDAVGAFDPREGVDAFWPGKGVIYHRRLSAQRTRSKLNKMLATPFYKAMTIRSWQTTEKLLAMLERYVGWANHLSSLPEWASGLWKSQVTSAPRSHD